MSSDHEDQVQQPHILRPRPRRPFELSLTPATSSSDSHPSTPPSSTTDNARDAFSAQLDARLGVGDNSGDGDGDGDGDNNGDGVGRSRSILNLTSGALFGIYQPTGFTDGSTPATPWGTGAETPARADADRGGLDWEQLRLSGLGSAAATAASSPALPQGIPGVGASGASKGGRRDKAAAAAAKGAKAAAGEAGGQQKVLPLAARAAALFVFGVSYGVIISQLHDNRHMAPVRVEGINRAHWGYLVFWGLAGVALGSALPWVDVLWEGKNGGRGRGGAGKKMGKAGRAAAVGSGGAREAESDWNAVVRSVGAFVGIAFAIRKLPWQSTLQVSLTLALVNPALWYLLDRSKPGFTLSSLVGLAGTAVLLLLGPHADSVAFIPNPPIITNSSSAVKWATTGSPGARSGGGGGGGGGAGAAADGYESVGVATWFASVLFCSCVCFGNIGRKLAIQGTA